MFIFEGLVSKEQVDEGSVVARRPAGYRVAAGPSADARVVIQRVTDSEVGCSDPYDPIVYIGPLNHEWMESA